MASARSCRSVASRDDSGMRGGGGLAPQQLSLLLLHLLLLGGHAVHADMGPVFGRSWTATVASNMTQVGFDMGMVLVNFTGSCVNPATQQARTVYGDFYTLLLLC